VNHKEVIILIAVVALLFILFYSFSLQSAPKEIAKSLFFKSLNVAINATDYVYAYEETTRGFNTKIKLVKNGNISMIDIITPLSEKIVYFTENDTILCVDFKNKSLCDSVKDKTSLQPYLLSLKGFFINSEKINSTIATMNFLYEKGALIFGDTVVEKQVDGKNCSEISFIINYSVLSLDDAVKVGIQPGTPMEIYGNVCIETQSGQWYEKTYAASYQGRKVLTSSKLLIADWTKAEKIIIPQLFDNSTLELFYAENDVQNDVLSCFNKEVAEKDKCVHNIAIWERLPSLCNIAGGRKDLCFFDLALLANEKDGCKLAGSLEDDCYLELAWKLRDINYCESIKNTTKKDFCIDEITNATRPNINGTNITTVNISTNETVN
jgi:hypothetical protein